MIALVGKRAWPLVGLEACHAQRGGEKSRPGRKSKGIRDEGCRPCTYLKYSREENCVAHVLRLTICKLGRKVMVVMVVMVSNGVMKNSSNGSNGSNHKLMDLKMDHVIMNQSIVVIG